MNILQGRLGWADIRGTRNDRWAWKGGLSSIYIVKSTYLTLFDTRDVNSDIEWKSMWNKLVSSKGLSFIWCVVRNHIPTKDLLIHKGIIPASKDVC